MARYFFDTDDGHRFVRDAFGQDCVSREEIRRAAINVLPGMATDELATNGSTDFAVFVRDEEGRPVFRANLKIEAEWLNGLDLK